MGQCEVNETGCECDGADAASTMSTGSDEELIESFEMLKEPQLVGGLTRNSIA